MPIAPITDIGVAVTTSIAAALALLLSGIPKIIGFAIILIIGWFVAGIVAKLVATILRSVKFNDLATKSGLSGFVSNMGVKRDPSGLIADVAKWFIRLIALVVAFDALGLPAVSDVLRSLLLFLPNVVVALVVLVLAGLAAQVVSRVAQGAAKGADIQNPELLGKVAAGVIWAFGLVVAVNQLGIATALVNTLFMALVGALALAFGLAFGLGGRETAGQIVQRWYESAGQMREKAQKAGEGVKSEASQLQRERQEQRSTRT
jgi:hypothetical protein